MYRVRVKVDHNEDVIFFCEQIDFQTYSPMVEFSSICLDPAIRSGIIMMPRKKIPDLLKDIGTLLLPWTVVMAIQGLRKDYGKNVSTLEVPNALQS